MGIAEFFGSLAPGTVFVTLPWRLEAIPGFNDHPRNLLPFKGAALVVALVVGGYLASNLVSVLRATLDSSYDAVRSSGTP